MRQTDVRLPVRHESLASFGSRGAGAVAIEVPRFRVVRSTAYRAPPSDL
jgi:hypothetical protein